MQHILDADGQWGHQDKSRWNAFLDWLSVKGLLSTAVQSREPVSGISVSLDELRRGDAGQPIARSSLASQMLFTEAYLPTAGPS